MYFKDDITYVSVFPQLDDDFASFVMLMRRQHLDNTTFFCVSQTCHTKEGEQ